MIVFAYPRVRHRRRLSPGPFKRYQKYKDALREEFARRCVYCRLPDSVPKPEAFGVDHYRPKSQFQHLECEYSNLFYACNGCNRRKGKFWPTPAMLAARQFLGRPRKNSTRR